MNIDNIVNRVEQLIDLGKKALSTSHYSEGSTWIDTDKVIGFRSAVLSFIERVYGKEHSHYKEFNSSVELYHPTGTKSGIAILESIREEISGGWLFTLKGLVTAEIFADFIEMAEYLLENDYKDSGAVIIGSVLEEHLRQLCLKNNLDIEIDVDGKTKPKKADRLNSDLAKAEVYNKLDQKSVTMWLDLRNKAAHGKYNEYTKEQVSNMLSGVMEFMARISI